VVSEGVVSVHAETKQHIERLKAEAGDEWDTGRAVRAALALSLAEEIDAGDTGRGQPRTSGLSKELRATLDELEPKGVVDDGDPDPPWTDDVSSTVLYPEGSDKGDVGSAGRRDKPAARSAVDAVATTGRRRRSRASS
jgi:hypothetical protein